MSSTRCDWLRRPRHGGAGHACERRRLAPPPPSRCSRRSPHCRVLWTTCSRTRSWSGSAGATLPPPPLPPPLLPTPAAASAAAALSAAALSADALSAAALATAALATAAASLAAAPRAASPPTPSAFSAPRGEAAARTRRSPGRGRGPGCVGRRRRGEEARPAVDAVLRDASWTRHGRVRKAARPHLPTPRAWSVRGRTPRAWRASV